MKPLRALLLLLGIVCAVQLFCMRYVTWYGSPEGDLTQLTLGCPWSPWFEREVRDGVVNMRVNPLSWSTLFGLAALGCFLAYARLRTYPPFNRDAESSERSADVPSGDAGCRKPSR